MKSEGGPLLGSTNEDAAAAAAAKPLDGAAAKPGALGAGSDDGRDASGASSPASMVAAPSVSIGSSRGASTESARAGS